MTNGSMIVIVALLSTAAATAAADNLAAFKAAEREVGCRSIPYSSLRSNCQSRQDVVNGSCKAGDRSCSGLGTKTLRENIESIAKKLESLARDRDKIKEEIGNLKSKLGNAKDDSEKRDIESRIREAENKVAESEKLTAELLARTDDMKKDIAARESKMRDRIPLGETCVQGRADVMRIFEDAISRAGSESDSDIKAIAQPLMKLWRTSVDDHKAPLEQAKDVVEVCRRALRGEIQP